MEEKKQTFKIADREVEISTGKIAIQAHGSIMLKMGGTVLHATASVDSRDSDLDYFPLGVEYIEKMYARGVMSGSRYKKREGLPSEEAIIKAREVDHSIRSLFPKSFKRPVSVILTVLAYDGVNDPQALTVLGTSLALLQSGVPFSGPCTSVIACLDKDGKVVINPDAKERETFDAEFILSAVDGKVLSLEGWGKEVADETMDTLLDTAMEVIENVNKQQVEFISTIKKTLDIDPNAYDNKPAPKELIDEVLKSYKAEIKTALFQEKVKREADMSVLKAKILKELEEKFSGNEEMSFKGMDYDQAVEYVARKLLRDGIMERDERVTGRKLEEIRELKGEIDVLPTVHGSALFSRGLTQSLSVVTLASASSALVIDGMEGEGEKHFMHHYNMPGYANGEAGRFGYHPGRREIGHGAIGENALMHMLPSQKDFPYTIRVVSEIMSSNGSTSMAATCASSMALMSAGVPLKEQVAGIGVGLVTEEGNEDNYKLIIDIEGVEDFYGDMDFKICGTKNGITAIQYENKLQGVKLAILKESFRLAKSGRMQLLETMNSIIAEPRKEVGENAPRVQTTQIDTEDIGFLIGPGGKNIKALVEDAKDFGPNDADISIEDSGEITITASSKQQLDYLLNRIDKMFERAVVDQIYDGEVERVESYGAFMRIGEDMSGLLHVSEISDKFVKDANEVVKVGQKMKVKVQKIDEKGRVNLTIKGVPQ